MYDDQVNQHKNNTKQLEILTKSHEIRLTVKLIYEGEHEGKILYLPFLLTKKASESIRRSVELQTNLKVIIVPKVNQ